MIRWWLLFLLSHCNETHEQSSGSIKSLVREFLPKLFQLDLLCAGYEAADAGSCFKTFKYFFFYFWKNLYGSCRDFDKSVNNFSKNFPPCKNFPYPPPPWPSSPRFLGWLMYGNDVKPEYNDHLGTPNQRVFRGRPLVS